jgi:hypothetical protein
MPAACLLLSAAHCFCVRIVCVADARDADRAGQPRDVFGAMILTGW